MYIDNFSFDPTNKMYSLRILFNSSWENTQSTGKYLVLKWRHSFELFVNKEQSGIISTEDKGTVYYRLRLSMGGGVREVPATVPLNSYMLYIRQSFLRVKPDFLDFYLFWNKYQKEHCSPTLHLWLVFNSRQLNTE